VPGLPFDESRGVVPHDRGRVLRDGAVAPGEYVAGWIKRGPTGVIGTNKSDAQETVTALLADAPALPAAPVRDPDAVLRLLAERGVDVVTWQGWRAIERAEAGLGRELGRERSKIVSRAELLRAAADGRVGHGA
jgi:ferredoxin--NADP+ reductase